MPRSTVLASFLLFTVYSFLAARSPMSAKSRPFSVVEASIPEMRHALEHKQITSRELVQQYLSRIEQYNGTLNAVITLNPRALEETGARDRERAQGKARGPLHGIPIAIKDNIQTVDMPLRSMFLAFQGVGNR